MVLLARNYLTSSGVASRDIKYTWDDWDVDSSYEPLDDDHVSNLEKMSHRANIAFTVASGEWIIFRYSVLSTDPVPSEYAEAAWAAIIDWRYAEYFEPPDEDWMGPIRGPLSLAIIMIVDAINRADQDDLPCIASASISNLAKHVIGNNAPYLDWEQKVVRRLQKLFAFDEDDPMGAVVPREALDPDFDFRIDMTADLIRAFLSKLDHTKNRFLVAPKEMVDMGFAGTPYVY